MDTKNVEQLAKMMDKYGLAHLEYGEGETHIVLTKKGGACGQGNDSGIAVQAAPAEAPPVSVDLAAAPVMAAPAPAPQAPGEALNAPLVGVAYLAPSPGAEPFVREGQQVQAGQVLCIIEAMKVMNEFTAPRAGTVAAICAQDGEMVEFGQCLFRLL